MARKSTNLSPLSGNITRSDGTWINRADYLFDTTDAFGIQIAESTRNIGDLAAHFPFSPERHRAFLNGTRLQLQYTTDPKFEDAADSFILKPAGGDVMRYRTAERFHYVVGYVIVPSWEFSLNQALTGNDKLVIGYGEPDLENDMADANGWFWEFRGGDATDSMYLTTYRRGDKRQEQQITKLPKPYTVPVRGEDRINWYNVGNRQARFTYTDNGRQINKLLAETSIDDAKGPDRANFPLTMAIKADAGTTGLELDIGSVGMRLFGEVEPIYRLKEAIQTQAHTGGGEWEALFALRKRDTDKDRNVKINLSDLEILEVSSDADVEVMAISVDQSKTDATGFATPVYHAEANSSVQVTGNVTTFPDNTGVTGTSTTNPGGYQVGFAAYFTAGTGTANRRDATSRGIRKRPIHDDDFIIVIAKTSTAMNITMGYEVEQQY